MLRLLFIAIYVFGASLAFGSEFDEEFGRAGSKVEAVEAGSTQLSLMENYTYQAELVGSHVFGRSGSGNAVGAEASGSVKKEGASLHIGGYGFFETERGDHSKVRGRLNQLGASYHLTPESRVFHGRDTIDLGQFQELPIMSLAEPKEIQNAPAKTYQRGRVLTSLSHSSTHHVLEGYVLHENQHHHQKGQTSVYLSDGLEQKCSESPYKNAGQFLARYRYFGFLHLEAMIGHLCNPGFTTSDSQTSKASPDNPTRAVGGSTSMNLGQAVVKMEAASFGILQGESNTLQSLGLGVDYADLSGNTASMEVANYRSSLADNNSITQSAFFGQYLALGGILSLKPKAGIVTSGGRTCHYVQLIALQRLGFGIQVGIGIDRILKNAEISGWNVPKKNASYIEVRKQF